MACSEGIFSGTKVSSQRGGTSLHFRENTLEPEVVSIDSQDGKANTVTAVSL